MTTEVDQQHLKGMDYVRAIMSIFVVYWHLGGFPGGAMSIQNMNVLLLAVPTFYLVSCYLYAGKVRSIGYLRSRVTQAILLLVFWAVVLHVCRSGITAIPPLLNRAASHPVLAAMTGLWTVYYFFFSLAAVLAVSHLCMRLSNAWVSAILALSFAGVMVAQVATIHFQIESLSAYWSPLNFLPYGPLGVLLTRHSKNLGLKAAGALATLAVALAIIEWQVLISPSFVPGQGYPMPAYTRLSLPCAAAAVVLLATNLRLPEVKAVSFLSRYSLALYCLHPIALIITRSIDDRLIALAVTLAACYAAGIWLKKYALTPRFI